MNRNKLIFLSLFSSLFLLASCFETGVFEKNISIPGHAWNSSFRPEIHFENSDTSSLYSIYAVIRHSDAYRYKNIWLTITTRAPGRAASTQSLDLQLATDENGWLGKGMDDIYEHRIPITREPQRLDSGTYSFVIGNIMREDPLEHVFNIGIRVEKVSN